MVKTFSNSPEGNERATIQAFRGNGLFRQLVDEATNPPALVLEHLDEDLLSLSGKRKLPIREVKRIARRFLQAISWMHELGLCIQVRANTSLREGSVSGLLILMADGGGVCRH